MAVTIQQFREAWKDKANRDAAVQMARQYCDENRSTLEPLIGNKTMNECVNLVSFARAAGNADVETQVEMWLVSQFEKQHIGGGLSQLRIRRPNG